MILFSIINKSNPWMYVGIFLLILSILGMSLLIIKFAKPISRFLNSIPLQWFEYEEWHIRGLGYVFITFSLIFIIIFIIIVVGKFV